MSEMRQDTSVSRIAVEEFAGQCRRSLTTLTPQVSYFEALSVESEQRRQMVTEPAEAIPKTLLDRLPPLRLILVPYLEKTSSGGAGLVSFEKPAVQRSLHSAVFDVHDELFVLLPVEGQDVADSHYWMYNALARAACDVLNEQEVTAFSTLVVDELNRSARGEVDDRSLQWKLKVQRRKRVPGRETKLMRSYLRAALEDTITLFLHGLCCDIDVEPRPTQLGSRYLRARLDLLAQIFPPNEGYLLFPEKKEEKSENAKSEA